MVFLVTAFKQKEVPSLYSGNFLPPCFRLVYLCTMKEKSCQQKVHIAKKNTKSNTKDSIAQITEVQFFSVSERDNFFPAKIENAPLLCQG